jgi:hypothetical protein
VISQVAPKVAGFSYLGTCLFPLVGSSADSDGLGFAFSPRWVHFGAHHYIDALCCAVQHSSLDIGSVQ